MYSSIILHYYRMKYSKQTQNIYVWNRNENRKINNFLTPHYNPGNVKLYYEYNIEAFCV